MVSDRILYMADYVMENDIYPATAEVKYDPLDLFLPEAIKNAKRCREYILAQPVVIRDCDRFAGLMRFDYSCVSELFGRHGHKAFEEVRSAFYGKPQENLCTFEWQHSTANYETVINYGIKGYLERIKKAKEKFAGDEYKINFLSALEMTCATIVDWAHKCADTCASLSEKAVDEDRKKELLTMAEILRNVPENPAKSFREAIQTVYMCFHFLPDSIGTPDRYLLPLYLSDIKNGVMTRDEAGKYIAELFLAINGYTPCKSSWAGDKGGESHFAIGGYTKDGEDGFNDLSRLIVETMMQIPVYRPQVSLRWTKKTPHEVFRFVLDCERKDRFKRFAFVNDEPRIKAYTEYLGLPYEKAVGYTMVGCNEPAFQGSIWFGGNTVNIARSLTNTLYGDTDKVLACKTFDEFYSLYEKSLHSDLERIKWYSDNFNKLRSGDINVLSTLFIDGCIENGETVTRGGAEIKVGGEELMGFICVIDSLSIIKQFCFDEKIVPLDEMLKALKANWEGFEELRTLIFKKGKFFGNGENISDEMAKRFTTSIYGFAHDKKGVFGNKILYGNLTGYNPHYAWFGAKTPATPDGRFSGDPFMVGIGQTAGKDREGLTALLSSIAGADPNGIMCGPSVTNLLLDESMVKNDGNFEKTVDALETYFKLGGLHFQLNYVSREELIDAKKCPEKHKSLRVRVSGFSAYFVNLNEAIQDNVIERTEIKK